MDIKIIDPKTFKNNPGSITVFFILTYCNKNILQWSKPVSRDTVGPIKCLVFNDNPVTHNKNLMCDSFRKNYPLHSAIIEHIINNFSDHLNLKCIFSNGFTDIRSEFVHFINNPVDTRIVTINHDQYYAFLNIDNTRLFKSNYVYINLDDDDPHGINAHKFPMKRNIRVISIDDLRLNIDKIDPNDELGNVVKYFLTTDEFQHFYKFTPKKLQPVINRYI